MKKILIALLVLVGLSHAQITFEAGRTQWGDSLRWGDSNDSTGYLRARGNAISRDSAGTWLTITTDSCSLPFRLGSVYSPNSKLELSYEVRTSSGNTDSSQAKIRFDTRYCPSDTTRCESWVSAGRFMPDTTTQIIDTLITQATTSGTTWKGTRQIFDVPGGNRIRACIDGYKAGGGTGDSTFFRRFVIRNSSIPAGGTPPSSATLTGAITVDNVAVTSSALPTGAATSAKQPALGTAGTSSTDVLSVQGIASGTAMPVSVASIPSHAVTNAGTFATQSAQSGTWTVQPGNTANTTAWKVDGSAVTQPVSGTVTANAGSGTMAVSAASLPLPALASTSTKQSDGTQKTQIVDGSGNVIASTSNNLNVQCANCSGSGASATDAATFTASTSTMAPAGAFYQTTATANPLTTGQQGMLQATAQRALFVNLRDASGSEVSVGGGTQYAEDVASADGHVGTAAMAVRKATPANTSGADGDYEMLQVSAGRLWVDASGKTLTVDGSGVTQPVSGTVTANAGTGTMAVSNAGTFATQAAQSGTWTVQPGNTANTTAWKVDGSAVTQPVSGTVTANAGTGTMTVGGVAASDAAVSGNPVLVAGRASAAAPADVSADGDVVPSWKLRNGAQATVITAAGALVGGDATNGLDVDITRNAALVAGSAVIGKVGIDQTTPGTTNLVALAANQSVNVAQINGVTALMGNGTTGTGSQRVTIASDNTAFSVNATAVGAAAHDAAISGAPVRLGARAITADYTAVAGGDAADLVSTIDGKLITKPHAIRASTWTYAAASGGLVNTTAATMKAAAAAGIRNCLTGIQVVNGHATVSTEVLVRDGAAGTVLHRGWAQAAGGGFAANFDVPLCGTAATLMEVVNVTTGSAVYVNAQGFISAD